MTELQFTTDSFPIWKAILWVFYPMSVLVAFELFLGAADAMMTMMMKAVEL